MLNVIIIAKSKDTYFSQIITINTRRNTKNKTEMDSFDNYFEQHLWALYIQLHSVFGWFGGCW